MSTIEKIILIWAIILVVLLLCNFLFWRRFPDSEDITKNGNL